MVGNGEEAEEVGVVTQVHELVMALCEMRNLVIAPYGMINFVTHTDQLVEILVAREVVADMVVMDMVALVAVQTHTHHFSHVTMALA